VLADQGLPDVPLVVTVTCDSPGSSCHSGGAVITVRVRSSVHLPLLPSLFGDQRSSFALTSSHTVPIGRYRESR
jgi:hypothetical protein